MAGVTMVTRARAAQPPLRAVVTIGGQSYEFREETGRDLGDFVSTIGGFTQRCVRADSSGCPLVVHFRPDVTSDRAEVVFELGGVFGATAFNLGAYRATIYRGETLLAAVDVPAHYHQSRWRWQSAPRPVVANVDQLIADGLLPPYDRSAVTPAPPPSQPTPTEPPPAPTPQPPPPQPVPQPPPTPPAPVPQPAPPAPQPAPPPPPPTPVPSVPEVNALPPPLEAAASSGGSSAAVADPIQAIIEYLQVLFGSGWWFLTAGDRRPGLLEKAAIGTAVGALAAKAFQMSGAEGAEIASSAEATVAFAPTLASQVYTPMGLAGVAAYMPMTGERDDIGLVTEHQARYICTGGADALETLRAQAEASGTVPWHMRDVTTNAPLNFVTYPRASWYWDSRVGDPWVKTVDTPVTPDTAHMPALSYLPYMLTGDPYHLEELQFAVTWSWGSNPPNYRPGVSQSRTFAWFLRNLAQCARVTPATVPSWLLPRSYWADLLERNRAFLESNYVNNPSPTRALFRSTGDIDNSRDEPTAPGGTWVDPWQEEFLASVMGWVLDMGFSQWRGAFDWKIGSTVARTGTSSGWPRAAATPYRVILRGSRTAPLATSWSEAWALTQPLQGYSAMTDPDAWMNADMTYLAYSRGALVYADKLGVAGASANAVWATGQLNTKGWRTAYKWRLGRGLT